MYFMASLERVCFLPPVFPEADDEIPDTTDPVRDVPLDSDVADFTNACWCCNSKLGWLAIHDFSNSLSTLPLLAE